MLDEVDIMAGGYDCVWEVSVILPNCLHIFKSCFHMVNRASGISLSWFDNIIMETVCYNNGSYGVVVQVIEHSITTIWK